MSAQPFFVRTRFAALALMATVAALPAHADRSGTEETARDAGAPRAAMKPVAPRKANGSGIEVQFRIDGTPRLGEALPITLSFVGITDPAGATVRFTADAGLSLPAAYLSKLPLSMGQTAPTLTVPVTPMAEGLAYLNVFTTQGGKTSANSVPVQVGKATASKPGGELKSTPSGDRILIVPVP
ncbi:MAG: hypothetical protein WA159_19445 [Variovorax sp.]